jgi:hypothetical protein
MFVSQTGEQDLVGKRQVVELANVEKGEYHRRDITVREHSQGGAKAFIRSFRDAFAFVSSLFTVHNTCLARLLVEVTTLLYCRW